VETAASRRVIHHLTFFIAVSSTFYPAAGIFQ
jgi:hypothetical protein